jgi:hypothetical protein
MSLSNTFKLFLNPIWVMDNFFTFYGGSDAPASSTTTTGIDPSIKPYVTDILSEGQKLYQSNNPQYYAGQTYVSPSQQTTQALNTAQGIATGGNPLLNTALQQQTDVAGGAYLQNNPYFNQAIQGAAQGATTNYMDAIKAAQGNASMSGRYGSGVSADIQNRAATTLGQTLANKYGDLAYANYANERGMQNAAAQNAPVLSQARYQDANQLMNVGKINEDYQNQALQADINRFNFGQNLPYQKLQNYANLINQAPAGTVSTTQNQGGKIVCTAMNAEYGFGSFRNAIWLAQSKDLDPAYEKGYHALFLPLVTYAYKSGTKSALQRILRGVLEHIARHRTADIWKQKRGKNRDNIGMIYRAILEPICYIVGKVGK